MQNRRAIIPEIPYAETPLCVACHRDSAVPTAQHVSAAIAGAIYEHTDRGNEIIAFLLKAMNGDIPGAKLGHRMDAARQLVKLGVRLGLDFINANPSVKRAARETPRAREKTARAVRELGKIARHARLIAGDIVNFLTDVMNGIEWNGDRPFKPHLRLAAARELIACMLDRIPEPQGAIDYAQSASDPEANANETIARNLLLAAGVAYPEDQGEIIYRNRENSAPKPEQPNAAPAAASPAAHENPSAAPEPSNENSAQNPTAPATPPRPQKDDALDAANPSHNSRAETPSPQNPNAAIADAPQSPHELAPDAPELAYEPYAPDLDLDYAPDLDYEPDEPELIPVPYPPDRDIEEDADLIRSAARAAAADQAQNPDAPKPANLRDALFSQVSDIALANMNRRPVDPEARARVWQALQAIVRRIESGLPPYPEDLLT